jgi:hypothetical protein
LSDPSLLLLLAANLATIGAALWLSFDLSELLLIYWLQSVMIGVSFFTRMLVNAGRPGTGYDQAPFRVITALFFVVHYGFFHYVYLIFLKPAGFPGLMSAIGLCGAAFAASHAYSLWHNLRRDLAAGVSGNTLFWLPYARVVPMHLTIIFAPQAGGGAHALLMFLGLKTLADLLMHVVEHRTLRPA